MNSLFSLQGLPAGERSLCSLPYDAFLQALHGFILVTSAQGRLVYVSENVAEYLGLSMVRPCIVTVETVRSFSVFVLNVKPLLCR